MPDEEFTIKKGMVDVEVEVNQTINIKRLPGSDIRYELTVSLNGVVDEGESGIEYLQSPGLKLLENTEWKNGTETISFDEFGLCNEFNAESKAPDDYVYINNISKQNMELRYGGTTEACEGPCRDGRGSCNHLIS